MLDTSVHRELRGCLVRPLHGGVDRFVSFIVCDQSIALVLQLPTSFYFYRIFGMGCVSTKRDGDGNQRRFHVKNLDDENRVVGEGELEVTDTHLVLYSKSQPIKWPLKYLRRYGYDDSLFSFEAGRRCPTGEGIYAFSTRNAEAIFRLVETNIRTGKSKRLTDDESDSAPPASETAGRGASPPADNAVSPTPVAIEPKLVTEGNSESGSTEMERISDNLIDHTLARNMNYTCFPSYEVTLQRFFSRTNRDVFCTYDVNPEDFCQKSAHSCH